MLDAGRSSGLPTALKWSAALFVLYGVGMLINVVVVQGAAGWGSTRDSPWVILNLLAAGLIAWGLLRRARWAWWLGLVVGGLWLVAGAMAVLVFEQGDIYWPAPSGFQTFLVGSLVCLGAALAFMISPSARAALRRP
jgi:hypothetical protein